ncbi:MAG: cytochrome c peroxidase [Nitrospirota bacterium]
MTFKSGLIAAAFIGLASLTMLSTVADRDAMSAPAPAQPPAVEEFITIEMLDGVTAFPGNISALPPVSIPKDNPGTPEKIELGRRLFFDTRLSGDNRFSCAWCHNPALAFTDGLPRASGFGNKELGRHSPTVLNAAYMATQFWDGRAATLEEQAQLPIINKDEMNLNADDLPKKLSAIPFYQQRFKKVFGEGPTLANVGKAIAAYERTLVTRDTPFDRYLRGDKQALTDQQKRGLILFISRAACSRCHNGPNLADDKFHNIGLPQAGPMKEDVGRYAVTRDEKDRRAFKTSSLRNVALTPPYMHNGIFTTLDEVVDFYNKGGEDDPNKDPEIFPLNLTAEEQLDLVAFLRALNGWTPEMEAAATGMAD